MKLNIKGIGLGLSLGAMLMLAGCTEDDKKVPVKDNPTVIAGTEYTTEQLQGMELNDGFDYTVTDVLLAEILEKYYGKVEGADEAFAEYVNGLKAEGIEIPEEEQEQLRNQMEYSTQLQQAYDDIIDITDEDIKKAMDDGFFVVDVEHAVLNPEKVAESEDVVKEVEERLSKVNSPEEYDTLREALMDEDKAHMLGSIMSKTTVIPGFEEILDEEKDSTIVFGEGNYRSVMKVVDKRDATEDEVYESLRNQEITEKYTDLATLLFALESHFEDLTFGEKLKEIIKNGDDEEDVDKQEDKK